MSPKVGRPTKYKEEYNEQAYRYCLLGYTDKELGVAFEVNADTIYQWKNTYPKFSESISNGKDKADSLIVESLYKRAQGVIVTEERITSGGENDVITKITKELPPDTKAIEFWLKNRQPEKFRDKQEIKAEIKADVTVEQKTLKDLPPEQLAMIKQAFLDNQEPEDDE